MSEFNVERKKVDDEIEIWEVTIKTQPNENAETKDKVDILELVKSTKQLIESDRDVYDFATDDDIKDIQKKISESGHLKNECNEPIAFITHKDVCDKLADTFIKKNAKYGDSFAKLYNNFGIFSSYMQISHKFNRLENLIVNQDLKNERDGVLDTLLDLANYCIMTYVLYTNQPIGTKIEKECNASTSIPNTTQQIFDISSKPEPELFEDNLSKPAADMINSLIKEEDKKIKDSLKAEHVLLATIDLRTCVVHKSILFKYNKIFQLCFNDEMEKILNNLVYGVMKGGSMDEAGTILTKIIYGIKRIKESNIISEYGLNELINNLEKIKKAKISIEDKKAVTHLIDQITEMIFSLDCFL